MSYRYVTSPSDITPGYEADENETVAALLQGIPDQGGHADKQAWELIVRSAFQGGLVAALPPTPPALTLVEKEEPV